MDKKSSPLFSNYILESLQMDETPFNALYDCLDGNGTVDIPEGPFADIIDEYPDKPAKKDVFDLSKFDEYVSLVLRTPARGYAIDPAYSTSQSIAAIDNVLLNAIFRNGHFCLDDLMLMIRWDWNFSPAGNMAAFYDSTVSSGHYLFDLGVKLDRYFVEENRKRCTMEVSLRTDIPSRRKCPDTMSADPTSWLLFVPFVYSKLHLGGSALSSIAGNGSGAEMDLGDADYFIDCYEVVRELVEDGVITSGIATGRGGLAIAAEKFRGKAGFILDVGGICEASGENDLVKILFAEVPGVLVEIRDIDYDYVDSQFMLQDIAYFPVGHPSPEMKTLRVEKESKSSVASILASLLGNQQSEGED